jgi:hypothetical protein
MYNRNIERFIGAFNEGNTSNTDIKKTAADISTDLSSSSTIDSVKNLVASTISSTIVNSSSKIQQIINAKNSISITARSNCKSSGAINIKNVNQTNIITADMVANQTTTVKNDITNTIKNDITNNIKKITTNMDTKAISSTMEGALKATTEALEKSVKAGAQVVDQAVCGAGLGNSCDSSTTTINENAIKEALNLKDDFKFNDKNNINNVVKNNLSTNDVTDIIAEVSGANEIALDQVCPTDINFEDVSQTLNITSLMKSTKVNDIANKIATDYTNLIITSFTNMLTNTKDNTVGDIPAAGAAAAAVIRAGGDAGAQVILAGGEAGSKLLTAGGDAAAKGIEASGDAAAKALTAGGGAAAATASSLNVLWIVLGVIVVILVIAAIIILPKMKPGQSFMSLFTKSADGTADIATNIAAKSKYHINLLNSFLPAALL